MKLRLAQVNSSCNQDYNTMWPHANCKFITTREGYLEAVSLDKLHEEKKIGEKHGFKE